MHSEVSENIPAKYRRVRMPFFQKRQGSEASIEYDLQAWDLNLRKANVALHFTRYRLLDTTVFA